MRKLKRSIARARMQKEGIQHINKKQIDKIDIKGRVLPSFFSMNWRSYFERG